MFYSVFIKILWFSLIFRKVIIDSHEFSRTSGRPPATCCHIRSLLIGNDSKKESWRPEKKNVMLLFHFPLMVICFFWCLQQLWMYCCMPWPGLSLSPLKQNRAFIQKSARTPEARLCLKYHYFSGLGPDHERNRPESEVEHTHFLSLFTTSFPSLTPRSGTKSSRSTERAPGTWPTPEPSSWSSPEADAFVSCWRGGQGRSPSTVSTHNKLNPVLRIISNTETVLSSLS